MLNAQAGDRGLQASRTRKVEKHYSHLRPILSRTPFVLALPSSIRTRPQGDATTVICRDNCPWLSGNRDTHVAVLAMTLVVQPALASRANRNAPLRDIMTKQ